MHTPRTIPASNRHTTTARMCSSPNPCQCRDPQAATPVVGTETSLKLGARLRTRLAEPLTHAWHNGITRIGSRLTICPIIGVDWPHYRSWVLCVVEACSCHRDHSRPGIHRFNFFTLMLIKHTLRRVQSQFLQPRFHTPAQCQGTTTSNEDQRLMTPYQASPNRSTSPVSITPNLPAVPSSQDACSPTS